MSSDKIYDFKIPASKIAFKLSNKPLISVDEEKVGEERIDCTIHEDVEQLKSVTVSDKTKIPQDCPYKLPLWSGRCPDGSDYSLEVLKTGCIVDKLHVNEKAFYIFGRHTECDFQMEHPSISRYHAVLQYRSLGDDRKDEIGWYLYDLGSTHGTVINKQKVSPHMHVRLKVGHVIKFGGSTRLFILQGPDEDTEQESELTVTQIKEKAQKQKLLMNVSKTAKAFPIANAEKPAVRLTDEEKADIASKLKDEDKEGIDWGMGVDSYDVGNDQEEDQDEEGETINFENIEEREKLYIDDPRKTLKNFFDREGCELNYELVEKGSSSHRQWYCRIELPVETNTGRSIYAEATVSGGKKEASAACALEACRMLDAYGVLRKSHQESKKKRPKNLRDDEFYDSDDDTFLDRTGDVEKRRQARIQRQVAQDAAGLKRTAATVVDNYASLQAKLSDVQREMERVQRRIDLLNAELKSRSSETSSVGDKDALDEYMMNMTQTDSSKAKLECSKLRLQLLDLQKSESRLKKLVAIARPSSTLPALKQSETDKKLSLQQSLNSKLRRGNAKLTFEMTTQKRDDSLQVKTVFLGEEEIEVEEPEANLESDSVAQGSNLESLVVQQHKDILAGAETSTKRVADASSVELTVKRARPRKHQQPATAEILKRVQVDEEKKTSNYEDIDDPNYATWMPPEDQSGDGRTTLNDKFGY